MSTVFEVNGPAVGPVEPHDTIKWTSAMETALLKMARQAQFDFDKVSKGMKAAVQRGLVRALFQPAGCNFSLFIVFSMYGARLHVMHPQKLQRN